MMLSVLILISLLLLTPTTVNAFMQPALSSTFHSRCYNNYSNKCCSISSWMLAAESTSNSNNDVFVTTSSTTTLSLSFTKPLGLILEEVEDGKGVYVKEISDSGSAANLADSNKKQIIGSTLLSVQGKDIRYSDLDTVINTIINAPDTVNIEFSILVGAEEKTTTTSITVTDYAVGTAVTIRVKQKGKDDLAIQAKVGDNLRKTLLENGIDVYEGLKQKLGNCGGAGQCTFCAFDFIETDGWVDRSEYEDQKIKKFPIARLTCLNNIQGPATISKTAR